MRVSLRLAGGLLFAAALAACAGRGASVVPGTAQGTSPSGGDHLVQLNAREALDPASGHILHGALGRTAGQNTPVSPTAWDDVNNEEIADKCATWKGYVLDADAGGFPVQPLWSNVTGTCRLHHGGT